MTMRIRFIDIARAMAMLFIVLGHTLVYSQHCQQVYKFLYSFHVALFFVISGYTFTISDNYIEFIKKKFIRIMIPYFFWSLMFLIPYLLFGKRIESVLNTDSSFGIINQIKNIIYGNGNNSALKQNSSLWFLPALFSMEMTYSIIIKKLHKSRKIITNIVLCLILICIGFISEKFFTEFYLPWGINTVIQMGIFFYTGYIMKENNFIEKFSSKNLFTIILAFLGIICCFLNYRKVSAIDYNYGNYFFALMSGLFISTTVVLVSAKITSNKILEFIGRNTMVILIFHKIAILIAQTKLGMVSEILKNSNLLMELILAFCVVAVSVASSIVMGVFLRKGFPVLIGEKTKKS